MSVTNHPPPPRGKRVIGVLARIALVVGAAFWGLAAGGLVGGQLVGGARNLDRMLDVMGYILAGGLVGIGVGVALCFLLKGRLLWIVAAILFGTTLVIVAWRHYVVRTAGLDPDSAYAGIPAFTASLEQTVVTDPYLRVRISVDAQERRWESVGPAPDNQVCRGTVRAERLQAISAALGDLAANGGGTACTEHAADPEQRFTWNLGGADGSLPISPACAAAVPEVAAMVRTMGMATASPTAPVRCD